MTGPHVLLLKITGNIYGVEAWGWPLNGRGDIDANCVCGLVAPQTVLNVDVFDEARVFLQELEAQLRLAAHQLLDQGWPQPSSPASGSSSAAAARVTRSRVRPAGVHGGLLQLARRHFAQALEAADLDLAPAGQLLGDDAPPCPRRRGHRRSCRPAETRKSGGWAR